MFRNVCVAVLMLACLVHGHAARAQTAFDPEARLAELNFTLPPPDTPIGNYVLAVQTGNLRFLAGPGECGDKFSRR